MSMSNAQITLTSSNMSTGHLSAPSRAVGPCKIYIVDDSDPDRERVIEMRTNGVTISTDNGFGGVQINQMLDAARIFQGTQRYKLDEVDLVPFDDGSYVRYNNFNVPPEEDDEE